MAFQAIKRADFVPDYQKDRSGFDIPLPIGYGQTISQPSTVYQMFEWLDIQAGHKVLDVGSGSGWTTALLAYLVGQSGFVHAVERIPELLHFGRSNCQKYQLANIKFHQAGKTYGLFKEAPFDRILVSAAADEVPSELIDQLASEGRMVIPVRNDILVIDKGTNGAISTSTYPGFVFVPLI